MEDNLTGVQVTPDRARNCLRECERDFRQAMENEKETDRENLEACGDDDDHAQDRDCRERERQRHKDAVRSIKDAFKPCVDGCHHQGGGHGR